MRVDGSKIIDCIVKLPWLDLSSIDSRSGTSIFPHLSAA
jgi:hypothetical protein